MARKHSGLTVLIENGNKKYSVDQLAMLLGYSTKYIRKLQGSGKLPYVVGSRCLSGEEMISFLKAEEGFSSRIH